MKELDIIEFLEEGGYAKGAVKTGWFLRLRFAYYILTSDYFMIKYTKLVAKENAKILRQM
jgi:hypothetical protein